MARPPKYKITEEDIKFLREVYLTGDWNMIKAYFPGIPKSKIYHWASDNSICSDYYFWSKHDKDILMHYYGTMPIKEIQSMLEKEYKIRTIQNQAKKMGLTESREWTKDEIQIMKDNYEFMTGIDLQKLIPKRSLGMIYNKAAELGLHSGYVHKYYYTEEEKRFILANWEFMNDKDIGKFLGKDARSVMEQRHKLGLYYPKLEISYYDINDYIRHNNQEWRKKSMENNHYKCVLSGSNDIEVHHKYSFNLILKEAMSDNRWIAKNIKDYTDSELLYLLSIFEEYQNKYPLGVCIDKNIHKQFHAIYGNRINTPEQWDEFVKLYNKK